MAAPPPGSPELAKLFLDLLGGGSDTGPPTSWDSSQHEITVPCVRSGFKAHGPISGTPEEVVPITLEEALDALLADRRTGDLDRDLIEAAKEALDRRIKNTQHGGAVIAAMVERGMSYRDIEKATGTPKSTAARWSVPPTESKG